MVLSYNLANPAVHGSISKQGACLGGFFITRLVELRPTNESTAVKVKQFDS